MENKNQKTGVSQKAVIFNKAGEIVTIRRSKTSPTRPFYWDLPGGILEPGEDKKEAILREFKEETGLDIKDIVVIDEGTWQEGEYSWTTICYMGRSKTNNIALSYEHDDFKWVTPEEIQKLQALPIHKKFVLKANGDN